jgi:hypothetical protein
VLGKRSFNKNSISTDIYKEIMTAENCKVVLLSGTPYINYPHELGVLFNLIGGYTYCLEVTIHLIKMSIEEKIFKKLLEQPYIESFEYEQKTHKLKIIQNPYGFSKEDNGRIKFDETMLISRDEFLEKIKELLKDNDLFTIKKVEYVKYKKFPESEIVFVAKYQGTQTGTQLYFREDSIFTLKTQTAFGWEQYNGNFVRVDTNGLYSLSYFNDHKAIWHYVEINGDKALLKVDLSDSTTKRIRTFQVLKNELTN